MFYIKKIVAQDITHEYAFQFTSVIDFFNARDEAFFADSFRVKTPSKLKVQIKFKYHEVEEQNGVLVFSEQKAEIVSLAYYNIDKAEIRLTSEFKKFFIDRNGQADDILIFYRPETTKKSFENKKFYEDIIFSIIHKKDSLYKLFEQLLTLNSSFSSNAKNFASLIFPAQETNIELDYLVGSLTNRNIIFYGAPGTGKSYLIKQHIGNNKKYVVTFHPDFDYNSFFGFYRPVTLENQTTVYSFSAKTFLEAYLDAWNNTDEKVFLVIEEINRGNCAHIFGDIFQLLDREINGYSSYIVDVDMDAGNYIEQHLKNKEQYKNQIKNQANIKEENFSYNKIMLPPNLYIFASMNTSDQSLYPIDAAFKRRWSMRYVPIDYSKVKDIYIKGVSTNNAQPKQYSWKEFLEKINKIIFKLTGSEDKQLGQFFIKTNNKEISLELFRDKILHYLWTEVFKDEIVSEDNFFVLNDNVISFGEAASDLNIIELLISNFLNNH